MRGVGVAPACRARRAWPLAAGALAVALLAGCSGAPGTDVTATGRSLTIYASAPASGAADSAKQDVLDAEQLAFTQKSGEVTAFKLSLSRLTANKLSDSARVAIQNTNAIAYLGELVPGDSADTLGITNAQQLLQISPTDTAAALTQTGTGIPGAPQRYYESLTMYHRTFARVVPTTVPEARAQAMEMGKLRVKHLYITGDGSDYARALQSSLRADLSGITITSGPPTSARFAASGADAMFFAGSSVPAAAQLFRAAAAARPGVKLFAPSALADPGLAASLGSSRLNLFVSSPGFLPKGLTAAGRAFVRAFVSAYHHVPVPQAIFGYEAMSALLDVIREGGSSAGDRGLLVHDFLSIKNRASAVGTYSMDGAGDTSLTTFVFERLRAGRLVPFAQVQG